MSGNRSVLPWLRAALATVLATGIVSCSAMPLQPQAMLEVTGVITDTSGRPIPGARLFFEAVTTPAHVVTFIEFVEADAEGRYSVSLFPGTYDVEARGGSFSSGLLWTGRITFDAAHAELSIQVATVLVTGTITGPTGVPIDSGYVFASGDVDGEGSHYAQQKFFSGVFQLPIPPGTYRFYANSAAPNSGLPTGRTGDIAVRADTTVTIEIEGDPLTGVVRGRGGTPLYSRVIAEGPAFCSAHTDEDGQYLLYVPPGSYRFTVQPAEAWVLPRFTTLYPISGPASLDFDVDGALWSGTVQDAGGQATPGAVVVAWMLGDSRSRSAVDTTEVGGAFRLLLERGREYVLSVFHTDPYTPAYSFPGSVANADTMFQIVIDTPAVP